MYTGDLDDMGDVRVNSDADGDEVVVLSDIQWCVQSDSHPNPANDL